MTSDQAPVVWPFLTGPGLAPVGAQMGVDVQTGAGFYFSPRDFVLDPSIGVANTNVLVVGAPGRGKSACTKAFLVRMMPFGYRAFINGDVKDEYEKLCHFFDVEPVAVGAGLPGRINPLDMGPLGRGISALPAAEGRRRADILFARWTSLIRGLVASQRIGTQPVPYTPSDAAVVAAVLEDLTGYARGHAHLTEITLPQLWHALNHPDPDLLHTLRYASAQDYYDATRLTRDALGSLVKGALAGIFDAPTTISLDPDAPIQSISLSRLKALGPEAVGIGLMCMGSWRAGHRDLGGTHHPRINVSDESWYRMRLGPEAVMDLDAELRLTRTATGDIEWMVLHKPGDLLAAGDLGSQANAIAKDLLHLADIKILHGQDEEIGAELADLLALTPGVRSMVTGWANGDRGRAVWLIGATPYQVATVLHPLERTLTWTNDNLAPPPTHAAGTPAAATPHRVDLDAAPSTDGGHR